MKATISELTTIGIFSALAFAGGYLFLAVPNVEVFTAIIFLSGIFLGSKNGMLVGLIAQSLFSTLNPYGVSPPPLFIAQVLNRVLVGYVGGRFQTFFDAEKKLWSTAIYFGGIGLLLTGLFDFMTDFSSFFISGFSLQQMKITFALGIPFYITHGFVNTVLFALVLPVLIRAIRRTELRIPAN
jgi:uncharacterized membrane protein